MRILFIFLTLFFSGLLSAQDFGAAIIFNETEAFGKYEEKLLSYVKSTFIGSKDIHREYYTWDGKPDSQPKPYKKFSSEKDGSKPITTALYLKTNLQIEDKLKTSYKVDTSGNVTKMYLHYPMTIKPSYKIVDLPTLEVMRVHKFDAKNWKLSEMYEVRDFKKYFGANPKKLEKDRDAFKVKMKEFMEKNGNSIDKFYNERFKKIGQSLSNIYNSIKALNDTRLFKVLQADLADKKIKEFQLDAKASENISKGDMLQMYKKSKYGEFEMYSEVGQLAFVQVNSADETGAMVKPFFLAKKKVSNALKEGGDIVFARNPLLIKEINKKDETLKRVQIKGECFLCNDYLERILLGLASTKLVERNFDGPRSFFTDKYSDEKFIDFDMLAIQDKQEGVDYLFEVNKDGVRATDVTTGRLSSADQKGKKGLFSGYKGPEVINLCMDIMGKEIQVVKVTKEKKGKVKKFLAYSPFGFEGVTTLDIYLVHEETVGGRVLEREEHIGKGWANRPETTFINEVKVAKGEKELYKALQDNQKIRFKVKL